MRPSSKIFLGIAVGFLAIAVVVIVYVTIGAAAGLKTSSFDEGGRHWPFATVYVSFGVCFLALASAAVIGLVRRQRGPRP